MKMKKRTAVAAVVALLICLAVYLDWSYQKGLDQGALNVGGNDVVSDEVRLLGLTSEVDGKPDDGGNEVSATDKKINEYFAQLRLTRKQARDEAVGVLETTAQDERISMEARAVAVASLSALTENAIIESRIDSLVLSKGYRDCATFLNDTSVSIVVAVKEGELKQEDAVRIKDIAAAETSVSPGNIRIIQARIG